MEILFILFMGFSRQEYWSGLPFPSPVDHILSDLSTMTRPSWMASRAWLSFIELDKAVVLVWLDWLVFCDYGFSVSAFLQHIPSYLGFSLVVGYLFTAAPAKHSCCSLPWEGLGAGGEGDDRGGDGWMASLTRWMRVWVNSGSWWWTGREAWHAAIHGVAKSRTRLSNWTELNWTERTLDLNFLEGSLNIDFLDFPNK